MMQKLRVKEKDLWLKWLDTIFPQRPTKMIARGKKKSIINHVKESEWKLSHREMTSANFFKTEER